MFVQADESLHVSTFQEALNALKKTQRYLRIKKNPKNLNMVVVTTVC